MWIRRIARRMPWSRNPLRRRPDRVQAWLTSVVIMVTLIAVPWLAWCATRTIYRSEARADAWERQHHHPVVAVLLQDAPAPEVSVAGGALPVLETASAAARWTTPDGAPRSGAVSVPGGTQAGSAVTVWVDDDGAMVPGPQRRSRTVDASVTALVTVASLTAVMGGIRRIVIWRLDRRRLLCWEAEWLVVGPRWSRR
jgi:hypothetical protein